MFREGKANSRECGPVIARNEVTKQSSIYCIKLVITALLFILPLFSFAGTPAMLISMQIQPSSSVTHIIFSLNKKTTGKVRFNTAKKQLIVEFKNTKKHLSMKNARLPGSNVASISTQTLGANQFQIIINVVDKIKWKTNFRVNQNGSAVLQLDIISLSPGVSPTSSLSTTSSSPFSTASFPFSTASSPRKRGPAKPTLLTQTTSPSRPFTIVIDAGHGGHDTGAIGPDGIREKNVVLGISKRLAGLINHSKNMRAVLTRSGDYYINLRQRLKLARKGDADLFIAIHADAHYDKYAKGASVYALSQRGATSEAARWLAQKENYSEIGDVEFASLQDRDPMLRSVLIDMSQTTTIQDSVRLGSNMLRTIGMVTKLHYNSVERAPFVVLKSPDIPSILIETGFISNPTEEKRLSDPRYQQVLAQAIFKGLQKYKK
jgi:N-acetylmuramoyl-L-alanine amidase